MPTTQSSGWVHGSNDVSKVTVQDRVGSSEGVMGGNRVSCREEISA